MFANVYHTPKNQKSYKARAQLKLRHWRCFAFSLTLRGFAPAICGRLPSWGALLPSHPSYRRPLAIIIPQAVFDVKSFVGNKVWQNLKVLAIALQSATGTLLQLPLPGSSLDPPAKYLSWLLPLQTLHRQGVATP